MSGLKPIFYDDNSVQGTNWRKRSNYRYYRFFSLKPVISIFMWCDDSFVLFVLLSTCVFTDQFICSSKCTAQTDIFCILNSFVQIVILYMTLSLHCSSLIIKNKLFFLPISASIYQSFCGSYFSWSEANSSSFKENCHTERWECKFTSFHFQKSVKLLLYYFSMLLRGYLMCSFHQQCLRVWLLHWFCWNLNAVGAQA